jgi:hypothetical protein
MPQARKPAATNPNREFAAPDQGIRPLAENQESLTLIKLLLIGDREIELGQHRPFSEVFAEMKLQNGEQ